MSIAAPTREIPWHSAGKTPSELRAKCQSKCEAPGSKIAAVLPRVNPVLDLATVSGPFMFLATTLVLEMAQTNYSPVRDTISALVWGRFGWAEAAAFCLFGLTVAALAIRLGTIATRNRSSRLGQGALALIALAFVVIAIFPTSSPLDAAGIRPQIHHQTVRMMAALFPLACLSVSKGTGPRYRILRGYSMATAVVAIALLPAGAVATFTDAPWLGAIERIVLGNGLLWVEAVAVQILLVDRQEFSFERRSGPVFAHRAAIPAQNVGQQEVDHEIARFLKENQIKRTF